MLPIFSSDVTDVQIGQTVFKSHLKEAGSQLVWQQYNPPQFT